MVTSVKFTKKVKVNKGILFTGLPGIGLVGKICVDYMLKQLNPEKIAEITSDSFPPSVQTSKGIISLIKDEIYLYRGNKNDFLFLAGPVQPALDLRLGSSYDHYEFARAIVESLKKYKLSEICALAGINIGDKRITSKPRVIASATDKKLLEEWEKLGAIVDKSEGLITGAAGLIPAIANEEYKVKASCLMGETNARLVYGDQGAAKAVLEILTKRYNLKISMDLIEKEAKEIENAFAELNKQLTEEPKVEPVDKLTYVR
ncbi:MAG: PAC2 family protein [Candidatus Diapherotrites archaeon]|nr:PAC2 family protein [Candidatus Diapherotrites archaeon]